MGVAGILGVALAGLLDHRQARHRGAEARGTCPTWPPAQRRTGIAPHRARRRHRPAGHPHHRPCATATTTSSTARRPGSPTPATPTRCRCWSRPTRRPTPAHKGMSRAAGRGRHPGLHGRSRTSRSSATRAPSPARSCSTTCRVPVDEPGRRRRGPRHAAGARRRWRPGRINVAARARRHRAGGVRRGAEVRHASARRSASRSPSSRRSSSSSPTWRPRSRPHGCWCTGPRPSADTGERVDMQAGMAKLFASEVGARGRPRRHAHPRRLRLLHRSSPSSASTATRPS